MRGSSKKFIYGVLSVALPLSAASVLTAPAYAAPKPTITATIKADRNCHLQATLKWKNFPGTVEADLGIYRDGQNLGNAGADSASGKRDSLTVGVGVPPSETVRQWSARGELRRDFPIVNVESRTLDLNC
jgi:hypothetical protein